MDFIYHLYGFTTLYLHECMNVYVLRDLRLKIIISKGRKCFGGRRSLVFNKYIALFFIHII
jgi:hypothetical protein